MKPVIQVTPYYPPHLGGVEVAAQTIAEALAATRPVEVLTSTVGAGDRPRVERSGQLTVRRLRSLELANTPIAPALGWHLLRQRRDCIVHVHIAQALTPEVVWLTSRLRGRPFIAHFHLDVDPSGPAGRWLAAYKRLVLGRVLRAAASVIVLSEDQARFVRDQYRVERVAVVPNGVPAGFTPGLAPGFAPGVAPGVGEARPAAAPLRVLFVGRLAPQKNLPRLLEALSLMREPAELTIVGDGPELAGLTELAARLGLDNLNLAGPQEHAGLGAWYRQADVFVLSSDKEGMPLAALEAMSFGLPVVATDVPGLRELCAGAGVLVPPDPAALAAALDSLAADPAARQVLARQSKARASGAGWEHSLEQIEDLYLGVGR
jgi:glycosyltransferase involved in cell wall biosynthesis